MTEENSLYDYLSWKDPDIPPPTDVDAPPAPDGWHPSVEELVEAHQENSPVLKACQPPEPEEWQLQELPPLDNWQVPVRDDAQQQDPEDTSPADDPTQRWAQAMPAHCIEINTKTGLCTINVWAFAKWFAQYADIRCINYQFYLGGSPITVALLKRTIVDIVCWEAEVSPQRLANIISQLESFTTQPPPVVDANSIHFQNKTLTLYRKDLVAQGKGNAETQSAADVNGADATQTSGATQTGGAGTALRMSKPQQLSLCRIPHNFNPNAGEPTQLLAFLNGLFAPDDLLTVQEYLGYCLLPSTKAQKALFIIGKGGEGKSRLSVLMKLVLGDTAVVSSVGQIGERFFGATLEHRLLFIDDDLQTAKFNSTDAFKSLVTNETDIQVEQKGKPHYQIRPCARFLMMGNQSVGSLHDKTHGFYRRIHIVNTLPAPRGRQNNPTLIQDIWAAEKDAILLWLVKGALRLARQNYKLTESEASRAALAALKEDDNTALSFLKEQTFTYGDGCSVTASCLTAKYKEWCCDNDLFKVGGQAFKQTCEAYFAKQGGRYTSTINTALGRVRGYLGVAFTYL